MAETTSFRIEDQAGLLVALGLHAAVVALLLLQPMRRDPPVIPERMTVSLATEVSLEATAPATVAESSAAIAPTLGEEVVPEDIAPQPDEAVPEVETEAPSPPTPRAAATPRARPTQAPRARSTPTPPRPRVAPTPRATDRGGSRIGDDFLLGQGGSCLLYTSDAADE